MPIKIYNSETKELLGELKSYSISRFRVTGIDIIWGIWVDAPFVDPKEQKGAFTLEVVNDDGKEIIFEDGWLKDVTGTRPNIAVRITAKKKE
ncbi:MAG TPA: hypothetical protein VH878_00395 [Thermodesulfobacteriota bacterium]